MASVYLSVDNDWINLQRSKLNPPQREDNLDSTDSVEGKYVANGLCQKRFVAQGKISGVQ